MVDGQEQPGTAAFPLEKQADHGVSRVQRQDRSQPPFTTSWSTCSSMPASARRRSIGQPSAALAALHDGRADALVVMKLDRLTRSVRDLGELVEKHFASGKAALLSVSGQIDTRSAVVDSCSTLASVSQWEREAIGERTSAAMKHKAAIGVRGWSTSWLSARR